MIRRITLQLLAQTLVLQPHALQLLPNLPLLLVELVLPLLLLLQLSFEAFFCNRSVCWLLRHWVSAEPSSPAHESLCSARIAPEKTARQSTRQAGFIRSAPIGDILRGFIIDATHKEFKRQRVEFLVLLSGARAASLLHEIDAYKSGLQASGRATRTAVSGGRLTRAKITGTYQ